MTKYFVVLKPSRTDGTLRCVGRPDTRRAGILYGFKRRADAERFAHRVEGSVSSVQGQDFNGLHTEDDHRALKIDAEAQFN